MIERPIFRNIQHVPKVWGVTYLKLFATLGSGLLATTLGFSLTSGATAVVKVMVIGLGVVVTGLIYAICFWIDNTDHLERDSSCFPEERDELAVAFSPATPVSRSGGCRCGFAICCETLTGTSRSWKMRCCTLIF